MSEHFITARMDTFGNKAAGMVDGIVTFILTAPITHVVGPVLVVLAVGWVAGLGRRALPAAGREWQARQQTQHLQSALYVLRHYRPDHFRHHGELMTRFTRLILAAVIAAMTGLAGAADAKPSFAYGDTTCLDVVEIVEVGSREKNVTQVWADYVSLTAYVRGAQEGQIHAFSIRKTAAQALSGFEVDTPYKYVTLKQAALDLAEWCRHNPTGTLFRALGSRWYEHNRAAVDASLKAWLDKQNREREQAPARP